MVSDEEIEEIRQRKLMALQKRLAEEQRRAQMEQQVEMQKQAILRTILTPEARQRITNLKLVKPEFASQLELYLIQLAQQGRLPVPLTDEQLKKILIQLQSHKREIKIRRM